MTKLGAEPTFAAALKTASSGLAQKGRRPPPHLDPQNNTAADTYDAEEYARLVAHLLASKELAAARDLSIITSSQNCVNRSDDSRLTFLSDLLPPRLVLPLGPSPAYVLVAVTKGGKTQRNNKPSYSGGLGAAQFGACR